MLQSIRLDGKRLIVRYRVSERLAARVGALLGRGVGVTGAVLELARPGSPAEKVLLHPDVLARAGRLTTGALSRVRKAARVPEAKLSPLVVVTGADAGAGAARRVIALEEEALAEKAWRSRKGPGSKVQGPGSGVRGQKFGRAGGGGRRGRGRLPLPPGGTVGGATRPDSLLRRGRGRMPLLPGAPAAETPEAMRDRILRGATAGEREAALQRFAESLRGGAPEAVAEAAAFLRGLERDDGPCPAGAVARAVGVLLSGDGATEELVIGAAAEYRRRLARVGHPEDLLAALGWMASGPRAPEALRRDVLALLLSLLERAAADVSGDLRRTERGTVIEFGEQDGRRMDYRRDLIAGAGRVLGAGGLSPGSLEPAVRRLLAVWAGAARYDVVCAPGDVEALAGALAAAAAAPGTPPALRATVIRAVGAEARSIPVIRALGEACAGADADPAAAGAYGEAAGRLEAMLGQADHAGAEDQEAILAALGRVAANPRLAADEAAGEAVRARLVDRLFEGLARKRKSAREALVTLAASANVLAPLRAAIRTRLAEGRGNDVMAQRKSGS